MRVCVCVCVCVCYFQVEACRGAAATCRGGYCFSQQDDQSTEENEVGMLVHYPLK